MICYYKIACTYLRQFSLQDFVLFPLVWMLATLLFLLAPQKDLHCCTMSWIVIYTVRLCLIFLSKFLCLTRYNDLVSLIFMTSFAIELSLPCSYDSKLEDENLEHIYILVVLSLLLFVTPPS
jgi:hypothetical protein